MNMRRRHLTSFFGLAFFIVIAAGSFSKATEPCTPKPVDLSTKNVSVSVYDRFTSTPLPGVTVDFYIRDHNPAFIEPDQCNFTESGLITTETSRLTNPEGIVNYETPAYEHDNSKDYTEITIEVYTPDHHPYRETKVLYYSQKYVFFYVFLITKTDQP